jgi:hypothetical protein
MKKLLRKTLPALILTLFLVSCGTVERTQPSPTEKKESTPTVFPASTVLPNIASTPTPLVTPFPTIPAQATIAAFDSLCIGAKEILNSENSPNDKWIAATCYWENGKEESPLQVVSLDGSKEWKIYFNDYGFGDRHDGILPYRWSKDERFLYAVAYSRISGCCWIGGKYNLVVRLNLETGEQTAIINGARGSDPTFSFTISENERFLLSTPMSNQPYDFAALDLLSGETRVVKLTESKPINLEFAVMSPYDDIIVLPLFKHIEYNDYVVESLAIVDLKFNEQRVLVSDLKEGEELYPIRWVDSEHVLVSSANPGFWNEKESAEYWSLNINTGERNRVEGP